MADRRSDLYFLQYRSYNDKNRSFTNHHLHG
uniref:Uncharacterized protein n=1 Tax=Rhizophora mucronata TaxID=61149 RepID=A0A2P2N5N8_RHIMU